MNLSKSNLNENKKDIQGLLNCSKQIERIDKELELLKIQKFQKIYNERRLYTSNIKNFWYEVFSINEDFAEYVQPSDTQYFEYLKNMHVEWEAANNDDCTSSTIKDIHSFKITFSFECEDPEILESQKITKIFKSKNFKGTDSQENEYENENEEDFNLVSEKVYIKWPKKINMNSKSSKKSFFSIFNWTSVKDESGSSGCTNINVEDFINLIVGDIFPNADKYFTLAQQDRLIEELNDADESEPELDISDDDQDQ